MVHSIPVDNEMSNVYDNACVVCINLAPGEECEGNA